MRSIEIEDLGAFDRHAASAKRMRGWHLQHLDLTAREEVLARLDPAGALFLGCRLSPAAEEDLRHRGAIVFPEVPDVPFDAYRARLYTATELYDGIDRGYEQTPDARIYAWSIAANHPHIGGTSVSDSLAMALHDTAVDDALADFVSGRRVVGVMGGHDLRRDEPGFAEAAQLASSLAGRGLTVATGGGPGAMEAANLGARFPNEPEAVSTALAAVAATPDFAGAITPWARAALEAVAAARTTDLSLGIPTWFYGHEPPNAFAGRIAKYFRNAIREDILLHVCNAGIVFLPGAAGTVQEVFQSACENYYSPAEKQRPLVLVGTRYWTEEFPAWSLLERLAVRGGFRLRVALVDSTDEIAGALGDEL